MANLSVVVASEDALPSAFSVYRGFEDNIPRIAEIGYTGIELALKDGKEINPGRLDNILSKYGLVVSCISTGQVYVDTGLMFTGESEAGKKKLMEVFKRIIDIASIHGKKVNIGRVRGFIGNGSRNAAVSRFLEMANLLSEYALKYEVTMLLEPVNRYELDFINNIKDAACLLRELNKPNFKIMADIFHMNIEDQVIGGEIIRHKDIISYIHLADSNRRAPGWGHTDFDELFSSLKLINYSGWFAVEILPFPDPDLAARQAINYLTPFFKKYDL